MEKIVIWYFLSLKECLKKRSSWLWLFGMLFLLWSTAGISIPDYKNMNVGICGRDSLYAEAIIESIFYKDESFLAVEYETQEELERAVTAGIVDCGFVFLKDFDRYIKENNPEDAILYISSPFSSKGEVAKERVFAAFLKLYSEEILKELEPDIFGNHNPKRMEAILEKNKRYQEGTEVFQMQITPVEAASGNAKQKEELCKDADKLIRGLVGLSVFLTMFLSYGSARLKEGDNVEAALSRKETFVYRYVKMMAAAFLPSLLGVVILQSDSFKGNFWQETAILICFLVLSATWISVVGRLLGRAEHLPLWLVSLSMVHILICPVICDFSIYMPAIKWLRYLLPLTVYLGT